MSVWAGNQARRYARSQAGLFPRHSITATAHLLLLEPGSGRCARPTCPVPPEETTGDQVRYEPVTESSGRVVGERDAHTVRSFYLGATLTRKAPTQIPLPRFVFHVACRGPTERGSEATPSSSAAPCCSASRRRSASFCSTWAWPPSN